MRFWLLRVGVGTAFAFAVLFVVFAMKIAVEHPAVVEQIKVEKNADKPSDIRMVFVGDIMLSRNIGQSMEQKKDYTFFFASTTAFTTSADIAFANLENPVSTGGIRSGSIYSFRADPRAIAGLTYGGFDVVSIANNHIWDYGKQAFNDTLAHLSENGIIAVGGGEDYETAHTPKLLTVRNTRVAFLAYTNLISAQLGLASSTSAVARYDDEILKADIAKAKLATDIVVVSFHWGDEYKTTHNAEQERVGKLAIDAGATIVVGHHPHVVQEVEEYNGGLILYSLGNFIFDQNFSTDTRRGLAVEVVLEENRISKVIKRGVSFTNAYQPYLAERKE